MDKGVAEAAAQAASKKVRAPATRRRAFCLRSPHTAVQGDTSAPQSDEWIKIQKNTFTNWVNVHVCALRVSFVMQASLALTRPLFASRLVHTPCSWPRLMSR
jgi:hypothetical protein